MTDASLDMLPPDRLARLLEIDPATPWSPADAAAALAHQLSAPLLPDLAQAPGAELTRLRPLVAPFPTLLSALTSATNLPDLELLHTIKNWARALRQDPSSPLSPGPATVLYYAAIAAALLRHNHSITSLTPAQLTEGFHWSAHHPGAEPLTSLFTLALTHLKSASQNAPT